MPYINGNLKLILAIGGFLLTIAGYAVGYGKLKEKVESNAGAIQAVHAELQQAEQDPDATAAGATLRGEIKVVHTQLEDMKQQLNRIEALVANKQR